MLPPAFVDVAGPLDSAVPVCNCHRRRNSLPGPGKFNTVHHSSPGHTLPVNSPNIPTPSTEPIAAPPQPPVSNATPVVNQDVPEQYIVDQLHRLGAFYWHKPETTDCTIQVPTDPRRLSRTPNFNVPSALNTGVFASTPLDVRRGSEPVSAHGNGLRALTNLKLHQFYLTAQSSLLRALFSGSSSLGLVSGQASAMPSSSSSSQYGPGFGLRRERQDSTIHPSKIPRLLPSSAHHPTLFLPLPDPSSFPHIVHYMYFGSPAFIEEALVMGTIKWEGVVRNVEYLGLFEGERGIRSWLAAWRQYQLSGFPSGTVLEEESEEEDEDDDFDSEDGEGEWSSSEEWDPMVMALAGMQMADPFATGSYQHPIHISEQGPGPLEIDPLNG